jgi:hypothetical protein
MAVSVRTVDSAPSVKVGSGVGKIAGPMTTNLALALTRNPAELLLLEERLAASV